MSKDEMRKIGMPSPNKADAFMLTFYKQIREKMQRVQKYDPLSYPNRKGRNDSVYE